MSTSRGGTRSKEEENSVFWGEIAPSEHFVHFYDEDGTVLDSLEEFIFDGIDQEESVVVIALNTHLEALEDRLVARGVNVDAAREADQYITVDAVRFLPTFLVGGWPDDELFRQAVLALLDRARKTGRPVRAFGELVAILWSQGHKGATVRLEHMWHELCETEVFSLYCAYPRTGFPQDASESIQEICDAHSAVIGRNPLRDVRTSPPPRASVS